MQLDYKSISFNTKWILPGSNSIIYRELIDSTLSIAMNKERQLKDARKIVITDNQVEGKGTHGKQWISSPYKDLTFSIILGKDHSFGQSLVNACCEKINASLLKYDLKGTVQYPNDIYINEKKIAGVLLSNIYTSGSEKSSFQSLSVGINVNSSFDIRKIDNAYKVGSTSMYLELNKNVGREKLLKRIIENIDAAIQKQESR